MIISGFYARPRQNYNLNVWEINFIRPGETNYFTVIYDKDPYLYPEIPDINVIVDKFNELEDKFNLKTGKKK